MRKLLFLLPVILVACQTAPITITPVEKEPPKITATPGSVHLERDPASDSSFYVLDHLIVVLPHQNVVRAEIRGIGGDNVAVFGFYVEATKPLVYGCEYITMRTNEKTIEHRGVRYNLGKKDDIFIEEIIFRFDPEALDAIARASFFQVSFCGLEFAPNEQQMIRVREFVQSAMTETTKSMKTFTL